MFSDAIPLPVNSASYAFSSICASAGHLYTLIFPYKLPFEFFTYYIYSPESIYRYIVFDMALTTRNDSLPSESEYESFANLISVNTPVSFTTNLTIIVPCLSNIRAISGYLRLDAINLFNALLPPGKEGFWSTSSPLNILLLSLSSVCRR